MITFTTKAHQLETTKVVEVIWNDENNTQLRVYEDIVAIHHAGEVYIVGRVGKGLEVNRRYWTRKINARLAEIEAAKPKPVGKLGQRVRDGWKPLTVAEVYQSAA